MPPTFNSLTLLQVLRSALDKNRLSNVTLVVADGPWDISKEILKDKMLAQAVGVIGYVR